MIRKFLGEQDFPAMRVDEEIPLVQNRGGIASCLFDDGFR